MKSIDLRVISFVGCLACGLLGYWGGSRFVAPIPNVVDHLQGANDVGVKADSSLPNAQVSISLAAILRDRDGWQRLEDVVLLASELDTVELSTAAEYLVDRSDDPYAEQLLRVVFTRWMKLDRVAAMAQLQQVQLGEGSVLSRLFQEQAQNWAQNEPDAVWNYANQLNLSAEQTERLRYAVLVTLSQRDPQRALALYNTLQSDQSVQGALSEIVEKLAQLDVELAKDLLSRASTADRSAIISGLLGYYKEVDIAEGLRFAQSLCSGMGNGQMAVYHLFSDRMKEQPAATLDLLSNLEQSSFRDEAFSMALSMWSNQDLEASLKWALPKIADPVVRNAWDSLVYTIAREMPVRGLELIAQNPDLAESRPHLISGWLDADPEAALDWAEANLKPAELNAVLSQGVYSVERSNPKSAIRLVDMMPMGDSRDLAMVHASRMLANEDVELAMNWVLSQEEGSAQRGSLNEVIGTWAAVDPIAAGEYALKFETENALLREQLVRQVVSQWAEVDPRAALIWVDSFEEQSMRDASMQGLVSQWAQKDFDSAQAYVMSLPSGDDRSKYLRTMLVSIVHKEPARAMQYFDGLAAVDKTDAITESLVMSWAKNDSVAASGWVNDLEAGRPRDLAASALVSQISSKVPQDALVWALSVEDEELRNRSLAYVIQGAQHLDLQVVSESIDAMTYDDKKVAWYRRTYLKDR